MQIKHMENWDKLFWTYNLPVQMFGDNGKFQPLVYMPRKESCVSLNTHVSQEELPDFCENTASVLRNLANLFESLGRGEIGHIYYPDKNIEEAKADFEKQRNNEPTF